MLLRQGGQPALPQQALVVHERAPVQQKSRGVARQQKSSGKTC
jgi:hypothetical protein